MLSRSSLLLLGAIGAAGLRGVSAFVVPTAPVAAYYRFTSSSSSSTSVSASAADPQEDAPPVRTADVLSKVAVAGATGRTGSLVVEELLGRGVDVVALVRDVEKAEEKLPMTAATKEDDVDGASVGALEVVKCDLGDEDAIKSAVAGCDASVWCATGFSDAPGVPLLDQLKRMMGMALIPRQSIDSVGVPALARAFESAEKGTGIPRVVMLSSAGVTRPRWSEEKKKKFRGSADIPIVRLNPFGILDVKAESEEMLRRSGVDYCIVRPTGLNDKWPAGSRPIFSQGDVAVGRINRRDVATVLVDCLTASEAAGKTFEAFAVAGYPPATSINRALSRLKLDEEGIPSDEALAAAYSVLQQLLPGEKQDAAALAMGQTYEQLDKNEVGRLGKRGQEDAEAAAPKPTS